ncbi:MAG: hypothetical protein HUU50_08175 [Candidatus Brocadiae bacterium]|nr:hypothetical protein [Candidatus Brocadiia bacterium]
MKCHFFCYLMFSIVFIFCTGCSLDVKNRCYCERIIKKIKQRPQDFSIKKIYSSATKDIHIQNDSLSEYCLLNFGEEAKDCSRVTSIKIEGIQYQKQILIECRFPSLKEAQIYAKKFHIPLQEEAEK